MPLLKLTHNPECLEKNDQYKALLLRYLESPESEISQREPYYEFILEHYPSIMTAGIWVQVLNQKKVPDKAIDFLLSNVDLLKSVLGSSKLNTDNFLCQKMTTLLDKCRDIILQLLAFEYGKQVYERIFKQSSLISDLGFSAKYPDVFIQLSAYHTFSADQIQAYISSLEPKKIAELVSAQVKSAGNNSFHRDFLERTFECVTKNNTLIRVLSGLSPHKVAPYFCEGTWQALGKEMAIAILRLYKNDFSQPNYEVVFIQKLILKCSLKELREGGLLAYYRSYVKKDALISIARKCDSSFFEDATACELLFSTSAIDVLSVYEIETIINANSRMVDLLIQYGRVEKLYNNKPTDTSDLLLKFPKLMRGLPIASLVHAFDQTTQQTKSLLQGRDIDKEYEQCLKKIASDGRQTEFFVKYPKLLRHVDIADVISIAERHKNIDAFLQTSDAPIEIIERLTTLSSGLDYLSQHPVLLNRLSNDVLLSAYKKHKGIRDYIDANNSGLSKQFIWQLVIVRSFINNILISFSSIKLSADSVPFSLAKVSFFHS